MEQLKPCPFCGGEAVIHVENGVMVTCTECECRTITVMDGIFAGRYTNTAVKNSICRWNRRVNDTTQE